MCQIDQVDNIDQIVQTDQTDQTDQIYQRETLMSSLNYLNPALKISLQHLNTFWNERVSLYQIDQIDQTDQTDQND